MVIGKTHTNLIFDIVVPFGFPLSDDEVSEKVKELARQMEELKAAVPDAVKTAGENYVAAVRADSDSIEEMFQSTVNTGYRNMYFFLAGANLLGLILLAFYKEDRKKNEQ